ncbi:efflux RND transporter periplasmic adaptor subunit [Paenirhodobacter sp. CAU 1674]|uniref:efflux RND transporter periplasmic adaptor subunit n=1 Tax=Paenirhodobacter sp. CAU 1674 TaxID=3032596 RepID=UPI0023DA3ED4|nr:efflux RND transporter periplasmic adaptor subunit [Paenirhodobacter sp. CAU 1674]MDF2140014.1 efflux RND transporter periplasmic adaptor subunit [Paenirhodobacter sp. CAU 1674]
MKFIPLVNAVLVSATLYALVFERDRLMGFVGSPPAPETATPAEAPPQQAVAVQAVHSVARPVDQAVLTRGQTEAARRVEVRSETSARVISDPLRRGAEVRAGDVLCQLDPGTRLAALAEARAKLTEAQLNATAAEKLQAGGYRSETAAAAATASLQEAQAGLEAATREIGRLTITAPFDGILEDDSAELGSLLSAGSLCATVIALDPIRLVGFVAETEIDRIAPGAPVAARLATGREVTGQVTYLSRSADATTRTFRIEAAVDNPDRTIREGQTVEMRIMAEGTQAHFLPASALTLNDAGDLGLRVAQDGVARFLPATFLRDTPEGVWLTGLPAAIDVIVVGQDYVTDGTALTVTLRDTPPAATVPEPQQ